MSMSFLSIPTIAVVQFENSYARRSCRIWLPLFLVWLLVALLSPLLLLVLLAACFLCRMSPARVIAVGWGIVTTLGGTTVEVQHQANHILVKVF